MGATAVLRPGNGFGCDGSPGVGTFLAGKRARYLRSATRVMSLAKASSERLVMRLRLTPRAVGGEMERRMSVVLRVSLDSV